VLRTCFDNGIVCSLVGGYASSLHLGCSFERGDEVARFSPPIQVLIPVASIACTSADDGMKWTPEAVFGKEERVGMLAGRRYRDWMLLVGRSDEAARCYPRHRA